jgi:hypothetical protein
VQRARRAQVARARRLERGRGRRHDVAKTRSKREGARGGRRACACALRIDLACQLSTAAPRSAAC